MKLHRTAVVAGKFYPYHNGHKALLEFAADLSEHLDVLLVSNENEEISPYVRALAIYETLHSHDITVHIVDDPYTDDTTDRSSAIWASLTKFILGYIPDVVVASETYGERWANEMATDFVSFDPSRTQVPVSGTMCRANAFVNSQYMPPATKRYMLPRFVVLGAESTGTTTLANALGAHYQTVVAPEAGRLIEEDARRLGGGGDKSWDDSLFWLTSRAQDASEERLAKEANGLLICDTDSLSTAIWYMYYMQKMSGVSGTQFGKLLDAGLEQAKKHRLYILTKDDIPFTQDELSTRTGENLRAWHSDRFEDILLRTGQPYIVVSGSLENRLEYAVNAIDRMLTAASV